MIRVVAHFRPKPGKLEEARQLLLGFTTPTRAEKGCVFYDLHENPADPEDLTFIEEWLSVEDLDAHGQSPHIQEGRKRLPGLMEVVDVRRYRLLG
jgi:quinol monooxygenase YgiN